MQNNQVEIVATLWKVWTNVSVQPRIVRATSRASAVKAVAGPTRVAGPYLRFADLFVSQ